MYRAHYDLIKKPFEITPDPSFFWLGEKHREAWATLEYGILENKGFLLLTGGIGTGKTALINFLIKSTKLRSVIATIPDPDLDSLDFFNFLAEEFQMNKQFDSKVNFLIEFKKFLYEVYGSDRRVLLIIDEAQRLNFEVLGQIRALSNIEMADRKLMNIFFVGQSEFVDMLKEERNEAVRKRIAVSYHIDPLSESETEQYINHRLNVAGAAKEIFTQNAIREIYSFTCGYPRLINIICDHALLTGYSKELNIIDEGIIIECEKDLHILSDLRQEKKEKAEFDGVQEAIDFIKAPKRKLSSKRIAIIVGLISSSVLIGYLIANFQLVKISQLTAKEITRPKSNEIAEEEMPNNEITKRRLLNEYQVSKNIPNNKSDSPKKITESSSNKDSAQLKDLTSFQEQKRIIYFNHKSNMLPNYAIETLDQIVKLSSYYPESEIVVEGYTDSLGDYLYNKNLSKVRAEAVKNYLVAKGVPATKINTFGMGSENPIESNETFDGRKKNRRVEIKLKLK